MPAIAGLLVWQLDVETDGGRAALECALVGGFHDAGTAPGDDGKALIRETARDIRRRRVVGMVGADACRTEDGDCRSDL